MRNRKKNIYFISVILILLSIPLLFLTSCIQAPGVLNGSAGGEQETIEVFEVKRGDIVQEISTTGSIATKTKNDYSLQSQGEIIYAVEKGREFKKGDLLVEADASVLLRSLEEQHKNIESIEKDIESAESSLNTAKISYQKALDENHIAIQLAELNEKKAEETSESALTSLENANRSAAISYQSSALALEHAEEMLQYAASGQVELQKEYEVENAELKLEGTAASNATATDQAESSYEKALLEQSSAYWNNLNSTQSAETQIKLASENIKTSELKLEQAEIKLDLAKLALQHLQEDLEDYKIYAQYDGMVLSNSYKAGEHSGNAGVVSVIGKDIVVSATVSENDIYKISEGVNADITLDAYKEMEFSGTVDRIVYVAIDDGGIVSYEVEVSFNNDIGLDIYQGLSTNVSIVSDEAKDVIYVPLQAVYKEGGNNYVDILNATQQTSKRQDLSKMIEKRKVTTGINDYYYVEIISGLEEGETIVTSDITR